MCLNSFDLEANRLHRKEYKVKHSNFFNWGLKQKLFSIVFFGVAIFFGISYFSYSRIDDLNNSVSVLGHKRIPITDTLGNVKSMGHAIPRFMWLAHALENNPEGRKGALNKLNSAIDTMNTEMNKLSGFDLVPEVKAKVGELEGDVKKLTESLPKGISYLEANDVEKDKLAKEYLIREMPPVALKITQSIIEIDDMIGKVNETTISKTDSEARNAKSALMWVSLVASMALICFGGLLALQLARQLAQVTDEVATGSSQVAAASEQLSRSSESLSSASQEQASSIEETSASLTEIMGMVEANVKTAESSNDTANKVHAMTEETRRYMEDLASAMSGILESNSRIEKLVKVIEEIGEKTEVIDDIVFKTQLLSFNASVEAERAGEHGRGFAVVAQEVGNLAQMSGKAATEIASIVKNSIKEAVSVAQENKTKVEKGGELAVETKNKMVEVSRSIMDILDGTNRIVTASKEQSTGINQITLSVENLNKATQETASTAEESSSASEELSSQAETMKSLVGELRKIITGHTDEDESSTSHSRKNSGSSTSKGRLGANVVSISKSKKWNSNKGIHTSSGNKGYGESLSDTPSHTDEAWEKI